MLAQASFDFTSPPPAQVGEVEILVAYLKNHPGFHTARQLAQALAFTDRKIRQIAEQTPDTIVSGPGSPGYSHMSHCPLDLVNHVTGKSISQGKKMIRKALITRRAARDRIGY